MKKILKGFLTFLLLMIVQLSFGQGKTITGTVTDDSGLPLPGVNVVVKSTNSGTQTDFDGNYTVNAQIGEIIQFSYVGFTTQQITIGSANTYDIALKAGAELEEVVVTGYGSKTKELSTSAISTVSEEEITSLVPSTSIDNILQGKAAGVQVTAANGRPGQTAFVQIRGVGSIGASTTPLYIVDGTPLDQAFVNNINPNDIASVSILKDASTVSLYGSRGANGVVVITTKQGKQGDASIIIRSSIGSASRIQDPFNLLDAAGKLELERQYAALGVSDAASLPGATANDEQRQALIALDTDWEDALLRNAFIQSNSVSISGADEKINYFFSMGYDKNTGIIDRIDGFERVSARLNTQYKAKDWLTLGTNVSATRSTTDLPRDRNNVQNPFRALYDYNPYEPLFLRDENGDVVTDPATGENIFNPTSTGFPIARALTTEPEDNRNFLLIGKLDADIKFSDSFSNRFSVGATSNRFNRTNRSLAGGVLQGFVGNADFPGTQTDNASINLQYNVNNIFNFNTTIAEKHNISADFLLEYNERIFTNLFVTSRGFPSPNIPFQNVAAEPTAGGSTEARSAIFSQGLFLDYDYDGKYIFSASLRNDGSSRFGPNNQNAFFYAASGAWNLGNEKFLEDTFVNDLKLRVSYGTSGNQDIPNNSFRSLLGFGTYNGSTAGSPLGVGNPDIQWESQKLLDIGVEFGLFNNRLSGVVDYFIKTSEDLLLPRPISNTVGDEDNSILSNIGEIENSGLEVSLKADVVRYQDFRFSVGGNVAFLDNEVKSLVTGDDIVPGNTILRVGEEINSFFLVRYAGVNPSNGEPLYLDADGNVTNQYSTSFQTLLKDKSPFANVEGGFFGNITYKGFSLRGDFVFKAGNYINNLQRLAGISIGNIDSNQREEAFNYWRQPGDQNVNPSPLYQATADQNSTRFLERGDYVRLRTLTLSYDLPSKFINDKLGISSLRIYGTGQNILTFTEYEGDPEIGIGSAETSQPGNAGFVPGQFSLFSYPQTKSYTIGLDIGL